jgi:1-acyl-sn-glycerol-3-phosphate acyltransferase
MLALRSGAPVVPVAVINTNRLLRSFKRVKVFIGKPILFSSRTELEGLEKKEQYSAIGNELTEIIQEMYRRGQ